MAFLGHIFITIFYQPFLNVLVLVYEGLNHFTPVDMGVAVIIFSLLIRLCLLPLSIAGMQSEDDRRKIGRAFNEIEEKYKSSEPLRFAAEKKKLIRLNRSAVRFEFINLAIQLAIALILWRVFGSGLGGKDLHLIYAWVPYSGQPFNLTFMGTIDLTKPSLLLNLISSGLMFVVETFSITFSPLPPTKQDRIVQFLLPVIVFLYLFRMPAGKKLFVVTTLLFSVGFTLIRETMHLFYLARHRK